MAPRKRKNDERLRLAEPELSDENEVRFKHGIDLFNKGRYWHAHDAWEEIWRELGDASEDDWEILLRGLIQIAAGLHCLAKGKEDGARGHLKKGVSKLRLRNDPFLGLDFGKMISKIERHSQCPACLMGLVLERTTVTHVT